MTKETGFLAPPEVAVCPEQLAAAGSAESAALKRERAGGGFIEYQLAGGEVRWRGADAAVPEGSAVLSVLSIGVHRIVREAAS